MPTELTTAHDRALQLVERVGAVWLSRSVVVDG
jgi:hypothetical protein